MDRKVRSSCSTVILFLLTFTCFHSPRDYFSRDEALQKAYVRFMQRVFAPIDGPVYLQLNSSKYRFPFPVLPMPLSHIPQQSPALKQMCKTVFPQHAEQAQLGMKSKEKNNVALLPERAWRLPLPDQGGRPGGGAAGAPAPGAAS